MTNRLQIEKEIDEIPEKPARFETFLIRSAGINDFTHGIFKYPCKFIPHIPRWAIKKYADHTNKKYGVLDPFAGSGTSLVESVRFGLPSYGIDPDPLSQLLIKVKTTTISKEEIRQINRLLTQIISDFKKTGLHPETIPELPNITHWFNADTIEDLTRVKFLIFELQCSNEIKDFFKICLASIIRKVSNADAQSPKPYVTSKVPKTPSNVIELFEKTLRVQLKKLKEFSLEAYGEPAKIVGNDAKNINTNYFMENPINLAITSPPYINAFDYVRSLRLENAWLDLVDLKNLSKCREIQVGTEQIPASIYNGKPHFLDLSILDEKILDIFNKDKKRAHVVHKFFTDMEANISNVYESLEDGGHYCIVVGDSNIRGTFIPTHEILIEIGKRNGFKLVDLFAYVIKNRYLRIPRQGKGGLIKTDWVITLEK